MPSSHHTLISLNNTLQLNKHALQCITAVRWLNWAPGDISLSHRLLNHQLHFQNFTVPAQAERGSWTATQKKVAHFVFVKFIHWLTTRRHSAKFNCVIMLFSAYEHCCVCTKCKWGVDVEDGVGFASLGSVWVCVGLSDCLFCKWLQVHTECRMAPSAASPRAQQTSRAEHIEPGCRPLGVRAG